MEEEHRNKIEDIKSHLYDPKAENINIAREGVLHSVAHEVAPAWKAEPRPDPVTMPIKKPPTSIFKKFFIGAVIFFICALGFAGYMYFNGAPSVSSDKIDIKVLGNSFTKGGDELPLQVEITNNNNASLQLADLVVEYPRGAQDDVSDVIRLPRDTIGTIGAGQTVTRNVNVTLFGDEKSIRNVKVTLEYHPEGSNAIFTKDVQYPVTISSAPLSLTINAPATATADQEISFSVTASLNTTLPAGSTMLQITYPNNFVFDSAAPAPVVTGIGGAVWDLSTLTQTAPVTIAVKGKLVGQDGDQQVFHVYAGTTSPTDKSHIDVVYNSLLQTMTITKPFLEAHILVDNQDLPTYSASGGNKVHAQVSWVNNLSTRITDAQIIVNLSGNAFDKTAVSSLDGFYDSENNRIVWDKNTNQDLASIEPGATGNVTFDFTPISLIGVSNIKDPQVALDLSIQGSQPAQGSNFGDVNNFSKKIVKIMSDFQIATSAEFGTGALPPKAEKQTTYNVTWTLSNSANTITQAQARAVLPIYVNWVGPLGGSTAENVTYNATTREVIWNIGTVRPNTGFNSNREATFTISLKPSLSQVGSTPQLMKDVNLTGSDAFAGVLIKNSAHPITTLLSNDPSFKSGDERVIN